MHIFSHKTVQLFVRSLRDYIKSFPYWKGWLALLGTVDFFTEKVDSFPEKVDCKTNSSSHSANNMYMKRINILWRAQTYRLGFLRRKGRFINRFLRIMKGWFLDFGDLCCNFVGAFEMHLSIAKDTRVNQQKYEPTQKLNYHEHLLQALSEQAQGVGHQG